METPIDCMDPDTSWGTWPSGHHNPHVILQKVAGLFLRNMGIMWNNIETMCGNGSKLDTTWYHYQIGCLIYLPISNLYLNWWWDMTYIHIWSFHILISLIAIWYAMNQKKYMNRIKTQNPWWRILAQDYRVSIGRIDQGRASGNCNRRGCGWEGMMVGMEKNNNNRFFYTWNKALENDVKFWTYILQGMCFSESVHVGTRED